MKFKTHLWILLLVLIITLVGCEASPAGGPATIPRQQATWTAILSLLVPLISVGIMQLGWSKKLNSLIALAVTVAVAFLDAYYFGMLTPDNLVQVVFEVLTGAIVTYKAIWEPLGIIDWWADKTTLRRFRVYEPALGKHADLGLPW